VTSCKYFSNAAAMSQDDVNPIYESARAFS
jgi:hypothetical protein